MHHTQHCDPARVAISSESKAPTGTKTKKTKQYSNHQFFVITSSSTHGIRLETKMDRLSLISHQSMNVPCTPLHNPKPMKNEIISSVSSARVEGTFLTEGPLFSYRVKHPTTPRELHPSPHTHCTPFHPDHVRVQ